MGDNVCGIRNKLGAMPAQSATGLLIFDKNFVGFVEKFFFDLGNGLMTVRLGGSAHAFQRPRQIHRRRASAAQICDHPAKLGKKFFFFLAAKFLRAQQNPKRGGNADRWRAAHAEFFDGLAESFDLVNAQINQFRWQFGLVDELDFIVEPFDGGDGHGNIPLKIFACFPNPI
jgi:hypothetical protein